MTVFLRQNISFWKFRSESQRHKYLYPSIFNTIKKIYLPKVWFTLVRKELRLYCNNVFEVSELCLGDVLEDKNILYWRRLQNVFKTSSVRLHQDQCLLGTYKGIQWVPNDSYPSRFIKYVPSFILDKLFYE